MPFNTQAPWNVTKVDIVTLTRAIHVDYTNDTGKTMFVMIEGIMHVEALNDYATFGADVDTWNVAGISLSSATIGLNLDTIGMMVFAVMPGSVYRISASQSGTGAYAIARWTEAY